MGKPILYAMLNWKMFDKLIFGDRPPVNGVMVGQFDDLPAEGLTMGTLIIGRQGTGKTSALAKHIVDYFKTYPDRAIFVLDWSGSISDGILKLVLQDDCENLVKRIVYDELGHPDLIIPMPEFSPLYGNYEEQVQRVSQNLVKLAPELVKDAPFLAGLGLREIAPQIFRMLTATTNIHDECWQVTEAKKFIVDPGQLRIAVNQFGYKVPESKWFLEKVFLELKRPERELRSYALLALLGAIEPRSTRARTGYYQPGWIPKEAIEKGLMVLVNGARLINEKNTQHYLFTQAYSLIMAEINKRTPGDPKDKPVALVMDEVYSLLSIPGMAEEVGMLSPLYRSRKLELYVVLQALSQLAETLRKQIWSIGNVVCFAISNFDEAYEIGQQLFKYQSTVTRLPPKSTTQQPILETDRGQYLTIANWLQRLNHRECVVRRYWSEQRQDKYVRLVPKTKEHPATHPLNTVQDLKDHLLKERGVPIRDALEVINQRKLTVADNNKKPPTIN